MHVASVRNLKRLFPLVLFLLTLKGLPALAQFSSGIEGTVVDSSGAAIPGARITITDARLGVNRTTTSNETGFFRIDSIAASIYTVHVEASGFTSWEQPDLTLQVGEIRALTPKLTVGSATTNVTVTAAAAALDLVSPTTGSVISSTTLQNTPLEGQNIYGLAALTPGMTGNAVTSGDNYTNEYAININAAGLRQNRMVTRSMVPIPTRLPAAAALLSRPIPKL
jgi:hypothetical protein